MSKRRVKGHEERFFAWTRQLTGDPKAHHAYVYDRETGRPIRTCTHRHRTDTTAWICAGAMLRAVRREEGER